MHKSDDVGCGQLHWLETLLFGILDLEFPEVHVIYNVYMYVYIYIYTYIYINMRGFFFTP